jgi:hypothetical protein
MTIAHNLNDNPRADLSRIGVLRQVRKLFKHLARLYGCVAVLVLVAKLLKPSERSCSRAFSDYAARPRPRVLRRNRRRHATPSPPRRKRELVFP